MNFLNRAATSATGTANFFVRTKTGERAGSIIIHNPSDNNAKALCYDLEYSVDSKAAQDLCNELSSGS